MFGNEEHTIWVEKYRPTNLDTYIGNEHIVEKVKIYLQNNDIPHLLFYGNAGTGKCLDASEKINVEIELTDEEVKLLHEKNVKFL
jgi:DNA polymerase III delta prime subunit